MRPVLSPLPEPWVKQRDLERVEGPPHLPPFLCPQGAVLLKSKSRSRDVGLPSDSPHLSDWEGVTGSIPSS